MGEHPDLAELDAVRTGEGRAEHALHLRGCAHCQREMAAIEGFARTLSSLVEAPVEIPPALDERILWDARRHAVAARRGLRRRRSSGAWAAAAAVAIIAGVTLRGLQGQEPAVVAGRAEESRAASAPDRAEGLERSRIATAPPVTADARPVMADASSVKADGSSVKADGSPVPADASSVTADARPMPGTAAATHLPLRAANDVDGDGRVDILDAFALARAVKRGDGTADVDGDGVVDARDVSGIARRVVALAKG